MPVRDYTTKVPPVPPLAGGVLSQLGIIRNALNKLIRIPDFNTYTPTRTLVTNLDAAVAGQFMYIRVGNLVFAMGQISADATAGGNAVTELGLTLPIASAFTAATQLLGGGTIDTGTSLVNIVVYADATNDRVHVYWYSPGTANYSIWIWFVYQIL